MVRKDSGIDSLDDLRGKTVATNAVGGSTDYLQDFYIEQETGLKPGATTRRSRSRSARCRRRCFAGRVDMGLFPQPFYGAINATGDVKTMFRLTDEIEPFVQLLNGCRRDFVEDNRDAIEQVPGGLDAGRATGSPTPPTATRSSRPAPRRPRSRRTCWTASC